MDVQALVERELGDASKAPECRPLRLREFAALPLPTRAQEAAERAQARADAARYGDKLQAALRSGPNWRDLPPRPGISASDYDVPQGRRV